MPALISILSLGCPSPLYPYQMPIPRPRFHRGSDDVVEKDLDNFHLWLSLPSYFWLTAR